MLHAPGIMGVFAIILSVFFYLLVFIFALYLISLFQRLVKAVEKIAHELSEKNREAG